MPRVEQTPVLDVAKVTDAGEEKALATALADIRALAGTPMAFVEVEDAAEITLTAGAVNICTIADVNRIVSIPVPDSGTAASTSLWLVQGTGGGHTVATWQHVGGVGDLYWSGAAAPVLQTAEGAVDRLSFLTVTTAADDTVTRAAWMGHD